MRNHIKHPAQLYILGMIFSEIIMIKLNESNGLTGDQVERKVHYTAGG